MTSKQEKLKFAGNYSDDEWRILASNPRFLNALDESTLEAKSEASIILKHSRDHAVRPGRLFPMIRIKPVAKSESN